MTGVTRHSQYVRHFFFSSRRRHTRLQGDWSSDVCSSDLRARFDGRSSFRTFVFGVIVWTAREARRRSALRRWLPLASMVVGPEGVDGRPDPATALARADETARLVRALGRLSARQRQVLHLVFYEDLTIAEAAAVAGVSVGTARTHYERGKAALKKLLENERE